MPFRDGRSARRPAIVDFANTRPYRLLTARSVISTQLRKGLFAKQQTGKLAVRGCSKSFRVDDVVSADHLRGGGHGRDDHAEPPRTIERVDLGHGRRGPPGD